VPDHADCGACGNQSLHGRFQGTGRACYGTLAVRAKTITWTTPFSQCKSMPYELVEQHKQGKKVSMTYRLKTHPGICRYTILALTHHGSADDTGWEVTGYGAEQRADHVMSCSLIREQEK
jgi:hypothetical protein